MDIAFTRSVPLAATDSHTIFLNPEGLEEEGITDVLEIVFVLAHEVSHRIFNDLVMSIIWRKTGQVLCPNGPLPYNHEIMNHAMDYRINAMLVDCHLGKMPGADFTMRRYRRRASSPASNSREALQEIQRQSAEFWQWNPTWRLRLASRATGEQIQKDKRASRDRGCRPACRADAGNHRRHLAHRRRDHQPDGAVGPASSRLDDEKVGTPRLDWRYQNRRLAGRHPPQYFAKTGHRGCGPIAVARDNLARSGRRRSTPSPAR